MESREISENTPNPKDKEVYDLAIQYFKLLENAETTREIKNTNFAVIASMIKKHYYEKAKYGARVKIKDITEDDWQDIDQNVMLRLWSKDLHEWVEKYNSNGLSLTKFLAKRFINEAHRLIARRKQIDPNVLFRYFQFSGIKEKYGVPIEPENYHIFSILTGLNIAVVMSIFRRWHEIVPIDDTRTDILDDGEGGRLIYTDNYDD